MHLGQLGTSRIKGQTVAIQWSWVQHQERLQRRDVFGIPGRDAPLSAANVQWVASVLVLLIKNIKKIRRSSLPNVIYEKLTVTLMSIHRRSFSSSRSQQTHDLPSQSDATKHLEAGAELLLLTSSVHKICRHKSGSKGSSSSGDSMSLKSEEAEGEGTGVRAKIALIRVEPTRLRGLPLILHGSAQIYMRSL